MKLFFFILIFLAVLLTDMLVGNVGFAVSITACSLIYFYGSYAGKAVFPAAVAAGFFLDMCYARPAAFSAAVLLAAAAAGIALLPPREHRSMLIRSLPAGAAASGVFVLGNAAAVSAIYGKSGYPSSIIVHLVTAMIAGVIFFPILIILLDALALKLNLPLYLAKAGADINPDSGRDERIPIETATRHRRKK
ncbi:MAG: hypothetical protein IKC65_01345 [Lentisphaeria bacterium]|nr:hypothetical protein [Lentisphaeria bacterium]